MSWPVLVAIQWPHVIWVIRFSATKTRNAAQQNVLAELGLSGEHLDPARQALAVADERWSRPSCCQVPTVEAESPTEVEEQFQSRCAVSSATARKA